MTLFDVGCWAPQSAELPLTKTFAPQTIHKSIRLAPSSSSKKRACPASGRRRGTLAAAAHQHGSSELSPGALGSSSTDVQSSSAGSAGLSSLGSKQQRRRRAGGSGARREDFSFFIARSDLTWEQPWRFEQAAPLAELRLRQQGVTGLDDEAAAAGWQQASTRFSVQLPLGLGALVVQGSVAAAVPLRCEFCDQAFSAAVEQEWDAVIYLGGAPEGQLELAANELLFRDDDQFCDITSIVTDAIVSALPTVCLCGGGTCRQHAGKQVVWSSTSPPASSPAASSPFAKLLKSKKK